jgi:hypothetical protein
MAYKQMLQSAIPTGRSVNPITIPAGVKAQILQAGPFHWPMLRSVKLPADGAADPDGNT